MDFLDPKKRRIRNIELITGYVLVGILLVLGAVILLYQAYGFGLNKHGQIIQNGLVFISSTPNPANIYLNGQPKSTTNARIILQSGQYLMQLKRNGYRTWSRAFTVEGGSVQHFDYPFLVPTNLVTKNTAAYTASPQLVTQTPDRRWLLVEKPGETGTFDQFDLNNPKLAPTTITIPANLLTSASGSPQSLSMVDWSTDNRYVILAHTFTGGTDYIMLDRQTPADSINLNKALGVTPSNISFWNNNYNQYYVYTAANQTLSTATLSAPTLKPIVSAVLAYKDYGSNIIVYASSQNAPKDEAAIRILDSGKTYNITDVAAGPTYLLDLAQYSGHWYLAAGASSENKVYVYEDPEQNLQQNPGQPVVPVDILKITDPDYVNFSADTRMLMAENGSQFSVYDALTDKDYNYTVSDPLDPPQSHAVWMNGEQITFVSGGKVVIFDYDDANQNTLSPANPANGVYFDQPYKYIYATSSNSNTSQAAANPFALTNTALRTPTDI